MSIETRGYAACRPLPKRSLLHSDICLGRQTYKSLDIHFDSASVQAHAGEISLGVGPRSNLVQMLFIMQSRYEAFNSDAMRAQRRVNMVVVNGIDVSD